MSDEPAPTTGSVTVIQETTQKDPLIPTKDSPKSSEEAITDLNSEDHLNFDTILTKIGFGWYQLKTYLVMGL